MKKCIRYQKFGYLAIIAATLFYWRFLYQTFHGNNLSTNHASTIHFKSIGFNDINQRFGSNVSSQSNKVENLSNRKVFYWFFSLDCKLNKQLHFYAKMAVLSALRHTALIPILIIHCNDYRRWYGIYVIFYGIVLSCMVWYCIILYWYWYCGYCIVFYYWYWIVIALVLYLLKCTVMYCIVLLIYIRIYSISLISIDMVIKRNSTSTSNISSLWSLQILLPMVTSSHCSRTCFYKWTTLTIVFSLIGRW